MKSMCSITRFSIASFDYPRQLKPKVWGFGSLVYRGIGSPIYRGIGSLVYRGIGSLVYRGIGRL